MRNIILHIGRSKTGTTSLQNFFYQNTEWLYNNGYEYPEIYRPKVAHHFLSRQFNRKALKSLTDTEIKKLIQDARNNILENTTSDKTILFSSEGMQACNPKIIRRIFNEKYFNVKIVCYFRDQISFLSSSYTQGIHESFKTHHPEEYIRSANPNYYEFISGWKNCFENLIVRNFSKKSLINEDIVDDFLNQVLSLRRPDKRIMNSNPSLSRRYLAFKLMLNKKHEEGSITIPKELNLYKLLGEVSRLDDSGKFMLSRLDAEYIFEKYEDSNKMFFSEYMPDENIYKFDNNYIDQKFYDMTENEFDNIYETLIGN